MKDLIICSYIRFFNYIKINQLQSGYSAVMFFMFFFYVITSKIFVYSYIFIGIFVTKVCHFCAFAYVKYACLFYIIIVRIIKGVHADPFYVKF